MSEQESLDPFNFLMDAFMVDGENSPGILRDGHDVDCPVVVKFYVHNRTLQLTRDGLFLHSVITAYKWRASSSARLVLPIPLGLYCYCAMM